MSSMGKAVLKKVAGIDVICREMTVAEIRALMTAGGTASVVDAALLKDAALDDLLAMTNLTAEQISEMRPSELQDVMAGCKEANPDFFNMLARLTTPASK